MHSLLTGKTTWGSDLWQGSIKLMHLKTHQKTHSVMTKKCVDIFICYQTKLIQVNWEWMSAGQMFLE